MLGEVLGVGVILALASDRPWCHSPLMGGRLWVEFHNCSSPEIVVKAYLTWDHLCATHTPLSEELLESQIMEGLLTGNLQSLKIF
jgi:hypothetical protein